jgi:CHAD domain-containing protein
MVRAGGSGQVAGAAARAHAAVPAMPDIGTVLVASLEERWHRFQMQLRRVRRSSTEASVHDLRVSMRRLMATVDMIRTVIPEDGLQKARRSLRKHLKEFNQLRDTHIQILTLRVLTREFPPLRPLGTELRRREARLIRAARGTISSIDTARLERALAEASVRLGTLLRLPGMQDVATAIAEGAMGEAFARAFELRQLVNPADPPSIHRLRVAFKQCRYMIEVLRPLLPGVDRRFLKSLNAYQTRMGEIQDMQVVTASVNSFTLNSRYAPTLSLVPVQHRLAEMRKHRIDEFLARADDVYDLWTSARVAPRFTPSAARGPRHRGTAVVTQRPTRKAIRRESARGATRRRPEGTLSAAARRHPARPRGKRRPTRRPRT